MNNDVFTNIKNNVDLKINKSDPESDVYEIAHRLFLIGKIIADTEESNDVFLDPNMDIYYAEDLDKFQGAIYFAISKIINKNASEIHKFIIEFYNKLGECINEYCNSYKTSSITPIQLLMLSYEIGKWQEENNEEAK